MYNTSGFYLNNLKKIRIFRKFKQIELAEMLNISLSTYGSIENLKRKARCQIITKLEKILEMPRSKIIGD